MLHMTTRRSFTLGALLAIASAVSLRAQDNYEIQVYGAETMPKGTTMFELHSNYATSGRRYPEAGVLPTDHALHETIEVTHGFTSWFEIGSYLFMSTAPDQGYNVVGSHIRPRIAAPASWKVPVGLSASLEVGYQRREYSQDTWSVELRPIIDKQMGVWYAAFNPVFDHSLRGDNAAAGFAFSPNVALTRDVTSLMNLGVEYYGSLGPVKSPEPRDNQVHQVFGVVNLNLAEDWEFNAGFGVGLTNATEHRMLKVILGRRVGKAPEKAKP